MIGIGIDFGTSNSAVAWFDGEEVYCLELEPGQIMAPTAVYIDRELQVTVGSAALEQYVEKNRGRRVEITARPIGVAAFDVREALDNDSPQQTAERRTLYGPSDDYGLPGRLFLGIKRLLGNKNLDRLNIFDRPFRLVALITPIMLAFRKALEPVLHGRKGSIYLGRPVVFEGNDGFAIKRLEEASGHARLEANSFYEEPVAACLSFLHHHGIVTDCNVMTVDFGGGTLDLSLVEWSKGSFKLLNTEGTAVGGDRIDQLIYRELLFPELGKGLTWTRVVDGKPVTTAFPFHLYERKLLNWPITHTLNQNEFTSNLHKFIKEGGEGVEKIKRLRDIIETNASYDIIQAIKAAKARLSEVDSTVLDIPEINLSLPFTRHQLDFIIADVVAELEERIEALLSQCGIYVGAVDYIVRTGGSCQLKAVVEALEARFPGKVVEHDTYTSVACGLAIASYHGGGQR